MSEITAETTPGVRDYVDAYTFRGDAGDHTPSEAERVMIEDAIEGYLASLEPLYVQLSKPMSREDIEAIGRAMAVPGSVVACEVPVFPAIRDVAIERRRQVEAEGWSPMRDDKHVKGEMARAAAVYAMPPDYREIEAGHFGVHDFTPPRPRFWPWSASWWKPTNRRRDLVKAGALIIAEIERLDRKAAGKGSSHG